MSKFTDEFIEEQRKIIAESNSQPREFAGADIDGGIFGCSGYHEETKEYELYQIARCGTPKTARYISAAAYNYPDALDEIERLLKALMHIEDIAAMASIENSDVMRDTLNQISAGARSVLEGGDK